MNIFKLQRDRILEVWRQSILADYSEQSRSCLTSNQDRFGNPVGRNIILATAEVVEYLFSEDVNFSGEALNELVRIRAVQAFPPSQAIGIIYDLKSVLQKTLWKSSFSYEETNSFKVLMQRLDEVQLIAFDQYSAHREVLAEIRIDEFRRRCGRTFHNTSNAAVNDLAATPNATIDQRQTTNGVSL